MNSQQQRSVRPVSPITESAPGTEVSGDRVKAGATERVRIEGESEEARNPKVARRPITPTKAMILAHEVHHAEYREWCAHCVAGKGISHHHKKTEGEQESAEFGIDYAFMTSDGNICHEDEVDENKLQGATAVIVGHDRQSKGIWAMVVDHKGAQDS